MSNMSERLRMVLENVVLNTRDAEMLTKEQARLELIFIRETLEVILEQEKNHE